MDTVPPPGQIVAQKPPLLGYIRTIVAAVAFSLAIIGFFVALGGMGALDKKCKEEDFFISNSQCEDLLRSTWWATFMHLFVSIGLAACLLVDIVESTIHALNAFLIVSTVQLIFAAEESLDAVDLFDETNASARSAATGFIFSAMSNFLFFLVIGVRNDVKPKFPSLGAVVGLWNSKESSGSQSNAQNAGSESAYPRVTQMEPNDLPSTVGSTRNAS